MSIFSFFFLKRGLKCLVMYGHEYSCNGNEVNSIGQVSKILPFNFATVEVQFFQFWLEDVVDGN